MGFVHQLIFTARWGGDEVRAVSEVRAVCVCVRIGLFESGLLLDNRATRRMGGSMGGHDERIAIR
jgi:hypothetical protein